MANTEVVILAHMHRNVFATVDGIARQHSLPRAKVAESLASLSERCLMAQVGDTRWFTRTGFAP